MPGFGDEPFGAFPFGEYRWANRAIWESVPERRRVLDENQELQLFLESVQEELESTRYKARALPLQIDPLVSISSATSEAYDISAASIVDDPDFGIVMELSVALGQDMSGTNVGPGYLSKFGESFFEVQRVRTRNEPETNNLIWVKANAVPASFTPGDSIVFSHQSLLKRLAQQYGVVFDENQPDRFRRSEVANAVTLMNLKATKQSYSVRGEMSGFDVEATQLWSTCGEFDEFPADRQFVFRGMNFTSIEPVPLRFDDIPADTTFDDPQLGAGTSILDRPYIYVDTSGDLLSPAGAFAENVLVADPLVSPPDPYVTVTSVVDISDPEPQTQPLLAIYSLFDGFETNFSGELVRTLVSPGSVTLTTSPGLGSEVFTDDGLGMLIGSGGGLGAIDYATGAVTLSYAIAPAVGLTLSAAYDWDALGFYEIPSGKRVFTAITPAQRSKIGVFEKGKFALVEDASEDEYLIEVEQSNLGSLSVFIVSHPDTPALGQYRLKYYPESLTGDCCYCPSSSIVVVVEITQDVVDYYGGSGAELNASIARMREKLEQLVPVHVRIEAFIKRLVIPVSGPVGSVGVSVSNFIPISAPFTAYYDDVEGDDIVADPPPGPVITVTITP